MTTEILENAGKIHTNINNLDADIFRVQNNSLKIFASTMRIESFSKDTLIEVEALIIQDLENQKAVLEEQFKNL